MYKYENELNGLLEELDRIDSHGDAEVREKRKEVVKAIEKVLEGVERVVSEAVEKRLSLISTTTPPADGILKGFDVDEGVTEEVTPAQEQAGIPVVVNDAMVPEPSTPVQVEETLVASPEVPSTVDDTVLESDTSVSSGTTTDHPAEPTSIESDAEASTATITPAPVELTSVAEVEQTQSWVPVNAPETLDKIGRAHV